MTADVVNGAIWLLAVALALLVCGLQRSKAAALLAVAIAASPAFYVALLVALGDVAAVRAFARDQRTGLILGAVQVAILTWALWLSVRLRRAKPGSRVTWSGRLLLPGPSEAEYAYITLARLEAHGIATAVTARWGEEELAIRRALAYLERGSPGGLGLRARLILHLLQPTIYRRLTARWAQQRIHIDRPDGGV